MNNDGALSLETLEREVVTWPDRARQIQVSTDEEYEWAASMIVALKELRRVIESHHKPLKEATHAAHRKVCEAERTLLAPLTEADQIVAPKCSAYLRRKEQERQIAETQAREAQRQREDDERQAAAAALEAEGQAEAAQEVLTAPSVAPPVVVPPSVPKTGLTTRSVWKAEVTDLRALCAAIGAGIVPLTVVEVKQSVLDTQARTLKRELAWPGVRPYQDTGLVRRG